ncbi:MAG: hypothetical protein KKF65_02500, partial [Nanoarchaeota archaeon]|nr:hypothetical protein [Nanoarchaeota archaeon]
DNNSICDNDERELSDDEVGYYENNNEESRTKNYPNTCGNNEKETICHKTESGWEELSVSSNAVDAHLALGDYCGKCKIEDTDDWCEKVLLEENIGRLDYISFDYREHDIPSFRITTNDSSKQFFYISDVEKLNLDDVKLKYYPNCDSKTVGPLLISLNGDEVFSGISDCGVYNTLYLDKNAVFKDKNELEFVATEGSYLIDRVSVRTELKELVYPVYYFELDEELFYDDDLKDDFNVSMSLRFVNNEEKRLEYNINGIRRQVSTDNFKYVVKLDDYVVSGTNSLELVPKTVIDITELLVTLDEED